MVIDVAGLAQHYALGGKSLRGTRANGERQMSRLIDRLVAARRWAEVLEWDERRIALGGVPEPANTYTLQALEGDLDILDNLTLQGAGADRTIIDGNGAVTDDRVVEIYNVAVT